MFISTLKELKDNLIKLDNYLLGNEEEVSFSKKLIKNGIVFIYAYGRFYPSRWVGYKDNNMVEHISKSNLPKGTKDPDKRDGKKTNRVITEILDVNNVPNEYLDELYKKYCYEMGVIPNNHKHSYWSLMSFEYSDDSIECENSKNQDGLVDIDKNHVNDVLDKIRKDPKYKNGFNPNNKKGYVYCGTELEKTINANDTSNFKIWLEKFVTAVNSTNHTHLWDVDKAVIVNELEIEDFKVLPRSFKKGFAIMERVQAKCSRGVYSLLTKVFNTYCCVNKKAENMYPKYDRILRDYLPKYYYKYFGKKIVIGTKLSDYPNYNNYVTNICKKCKVDKNGLDRLIWYIHKNDKKK